MSRDDVMAREPRDVFEASAGRKIALSFVFLLLLPFAFSTGPMLYYRITQGNGEGLVSLVIVAVAALALFLLVLIELMISLRSRVAFGKKAVRLTLPRGRGIFPSLIYRTHKIPYDAVERVEIRREVYGGHVAPVMLKGARVILKDDTAIPLGYVSEANVDPALPFDEIAEKIAARAHAEIVDVGHVHRSAQRQILGLRASDEERVPITAAEIAKLNRRHDQVIFLLIGLLVLLVGLGIASDRDARYPWLSNPASTAAATSTNAG